MYDFLHAKAVPITTIITVFQKIRFATLGGTFGKLVDDMTTRFRSNIDPRSRAPNQHARNIQTKRIQKALLSNTHHMNHIGQTNCQFLDSFGGLGDALICRDLDSYPFRISWYAWVIHGHIAVCYFVLYLYVCYN